MKVKDFKANLNKRCPVCKFKIRGLNHDKGEHHKKAEAKR